jgi:hypothetical protein
MAVLISQVYVFSKMGYQSKNMQAGSALLVYDLIVKIASKAPTVV